MKKNSIIAAEKISKTYSAGSEAFTAVKDVSLEIYEGDFTVIMGSSGSGKSTLLYMLSGLDSLSSGAVYMKGRQISALSEKETAELRAKKIGYVYQGINLVPDMTLFENIALPGYAAGGGKNAVRKRTAELMASVGIAGLENRYPAQVSGGQQQRAAIARAVVNSPDIIFADEPTGSLNQEYGFAVLNLLTEMNRQGQSIIMVTHDTKAACRADRVIYFKDGEIAGILELEKYNEGDLKARESQIFAYTNVQENSLAHKNISAGSERK